MTVRGMLVAVLPTEVVPTANIKALEDCPGSGSELCGLPPTWPAQPVATSVAIGPDGAFYMGELKGFPAPTGESKAWWVESNARNSKCGQSPLCSVVLDGFASVIDLVFGTDGRLYVEPDRRRARNYYAVIVLTELPPSSSVAAGANWGVHFKGG